MLREIDERILDAAQPVADSVHAWTGLDAIAQRRVIEGILGALWFAWVVRGRLAGEGFDWAGAILCLAWLYGAFIGDRERDQLIRQASSGSFRNPLRVSYVQIAARMAFAMVSIAGLGPLVVRGNFVGEAINAGTWGYFVWSALDVRPHRPERVPARRLAPVQGEA